MSNSQSRTEQMAYFESELGLDKATAILLFHAERFQEKGQLEMALEFFDQVLSSYPACAEAQVSRRMPAKILEKRKSRERRYQEIVEASENNVHPPVVTQMDVDWVWGAKECLHDEIMDKEDKDRCAFKAIRAELKRKGYEKSFVSLLKMPLWERIS